MRMLSLWLDSPEMGCGLKSYLEVYEDDQNETHLLHIPTLSHVVVRTSKIIEQDRDKVSRSELPYAGVIKDIGFSLEQARKFEFRVAGWFVRKALEGLQEYLQVPADVVAPIVTMTYAVVSETGKKPVDDISQIDPSDVAAIEVAVARKKDISNRKSVGFKAGVSTEDVLSEAIKLGYEEKAFPNNGVRRMRILNFLKSNGNHVE